MNVLRRASVTEPHHSSTRHPEELLLWTDIRQAKESEGGKREVSISGPDSHHSGGIGDHSRCGAAAIWLKFSGGS